MREKSLNFAKELIDTNNQYNRLKNSTKKRVERTFVGKLAEMAFLKHLHNIGIIYEDKGMFEIYDGQKNVDSFDFKTIYDETIDIKSASKPFHQRIMVPIDQFESISKDYYVGVKLNTKLKNDFIKINSIHTADIYGYCSYDELEKRITKNFGEYKCKAINLDELEDINDLLTEKFDPFRKTI